MPNDDWSDFIKAAKAAKEAAKNPPPSNGVTFNLAAAPSNGLRDRSYALAGLRRECDELAAMPPDSGRNNKLNEAVFSLVGFVPAMLSEEEVVDNLGAAALTAGLPYGEAQATIRSALNGSRAKGVVREVPPPTIGNLSAPASTAAEFFGTGTINGNGATILPVIPAVPMGLIDPGASTANGNASAGGDPDDTGALGLEQIEGEFWGSRDSLAIIYSAALSRMASPWATLAICAARALALVPPRWTLPPIVGGKGSLNWFAALATKSGGGKGAALGIAEALIPRDIYLRNLGSGEGLVSAFRRPSEVKNEPPTQRESVMFVASEVEQMKALGVRTGSTLMPLLRQAFSGETLGFSYKSDDTHLQAHTYRLTFVCGVQPETADAILGDRYGGTPQRFMWFPAMDRRITRGLVRSDDWLPTLDLPTTTELFYDREISVPDEARDMIVGAREAAARGDGDPLESHAIYAREKLAFALAVLDNRTEMTAEDWELSGIAAAVSTATRNWVVDKMNTTQRTAALERGALKGVESTAAKRTEAIEQTAPMRVLQQVVNRLNRDGNQGLPKKRLREAVGRYYPYLDDALELGTNAGVVQKIGTQWFAVQGATE